MLQIIRTTSSHPDFTQLAEWLDTELWARYQELQARYDKHNRVTDIHAVIAYQNAEPVGCAGMKTLDAQTVEIKRMYVRREFRGKKVAYALLSELERWATELSFTRAILETGFEQPEAIALYRKCGYGKIENFGPYIGMATSLCMAKSLI